MRRLRVVGLSLAFLSLAMLVVSAQAGTAKPQSGKVNETARVSVWDAVTTRTQLESARISQKAVGVSLPPGLAMSAAGYGSPKVSCPSVSGCLSTWGTANLLVLGEHRGKWSREATLAGVGLLALACPAIGSCVGTGWISGQPGVVTQSGRNWRASSVQFPPSAPGGLFVSVSCGSVGDCTAVGSGQIFKQYDIESHALAVSEKAGIWGEALDEQLPPDMATSPDPERDVGSTGGGASVISCASAGNCAMGGSYTAKVVEPHGPAYRSEGWVATKHAGVWRPATRVQLPAGADTGYSSFGIRGMSCPSARNCTAVGHYGGEGLILTERHGVWLRGTKAPQPSAARSRSLSCADPNDCADVTYNGWLVTERHGKWNASKLVLPRKTKAPGGVSLNQVSCPSRGNCVAIGFYLSHGKTNGLIDIERRGKWQRAIRASLPKNAAKATRQHGGLDSISCPSTNHCTTVGTYTDRAGKTQGLIVNLLIG